MGNNDDVVETSLGMVLSALKGTKEYWNRRQADLTTMDENLGPATFFLTLSCAEFSWSDMREFLEFMNSDLPSVKDMRTGYVAASDPVSVSEHFYHRYTTFFREVIRNKNGPLGEVTDYFWRIEYQSRGAPHCHM